MNSKILYFFLLVPIIALSQSKPFYKRTITAYQINKKDTIKKNVLVTYLDSLKQVITTENNAANAIAGSKEKSDKLKTIKLVDTDRLYIAADINQNNDTINKIIYVYNDKKQQTEYYQILRGDTVTGQKRYYDDKGNNTKLFNRKKGTSIYFLRMESEYDSKGNVIENKIYNEAGGLVGLSKCENVYKGDEVVITKFSYEQAKKDFVKQYTEITKGKLITTYFYYSSTGYNYGIELQSVDGGMRIEEKDDEGRLKELRYYDDKKRLTVLVTQVETKI
jgi:hypothetical protein